VKTVIAVPTDSTFAVESAAATRVANRPTPTRTGPASLPEATIAIRLLRLSTLAAFLVWAAAAGWALAYLLSH
jgi:hypothetical protein